MGGVNGGTPSGERSVDRSAATLLLTQDGGRDALDRLDVTPDAAEVLVVSAERSATAAVDDWRASHGSLPAAFGLISFGEFGRSAATRGADDGPSRRSLPGRDVTVTTMSDPGNLQRLGTAVTLYLDDWADTDRDTVVYVDDLTPFVEAGGLEPTFQFLHLLSQTVTGTNATLVVRADASATDEQTVNTLRPLFDAVIDNDAAPPALDTDTLHELLRNPRRRFVLRSLLAEEGTTLDRLAARLAAWENDTDEPTDAERTRAFTALASVHVPRLAEAGLVVFDRSAKRVSLSDAARDAGRLEGYLNESFDD
ncbi:ERAP1-like C-terminal domain-containing protein [Haloplanus ruber]|uniref:ERAP1-like C-terminal domain-containing protein n=1 Tax=Haloplanus ruber TaxID=869892 RepID=A0ABD6CUN3_9EURY|nr:ERAP1-like C-terminal domain-containing protein [Haloplanus ruber]